MNERDTGYLERNWYGLFILWPMKCWFHVLQILVKNNIQGTQSEGSNRFSLMIRNFVADGSHL